jgi:hypothetical protein
VPESFDTGICFADQQIAHSEFKSAKVLLDSIKPTDQGQQIKKILTLVELALVQYEPAVAIKFAQAATELDPMLLEAQAALVGAQLMAADVAAAQVALQTVDQALHSAGREADRYTLNNNINNIFFN